VAALFVSVCGGFEYKPSFEKLAADAETALDTNRLETAAELYGRAAALAPERVGEISLDWAWAHVEQGFYSIKGGEFEEADAHFRRAVDIDPAVKPHIGEIWTIARIRVFQQRIKAAREKPEEADWDALVGYARETAGFTGQRPHTHFALGLALEGAGETAEAEEHFRAAIKGVGAAVPEETDLREAAKKALNHSPIIVSLPVHPLWREVQEGPFMELSMPPFVIYHHNEEVARRVGQALRCFRAERILNGLLNRNDNLPRECRVYLYRDREEFLESTGMPDWAGAAARPIRAGHRILAAEIHLNQTMPMVFENSAAHELAHVRFAANPSAHANVPLWIQEGVATAAENENNREWMHRVLSKARDQDRLIPVRDMFRLQAVPRGFEDVFYAESHAMVAVMVEHFGSVRMWRFIRTLKGREQQSVLAQLFELRPVDLENMVLEWIHKRDEQILENASR